MPLLVAVLVFTVLQNSASAANYCGTSLSDAAKCNTACPKGLDSECPSAERCFAGVSCSTPDVPPPSTGNFCGSTSSDARKCETACPKGLDSECPSAERCFAGVSCNTPDVPPPSTGNYCGSTSSDARKCETACPKGLDSECPSAERCFAGVSCSTPDVPPPSTGNYCGATSSDARRCETACPKGLDSECPTVERCFAGVTCSRGFASSIVTTAKSEFRLYGNRHECQNAGMRKRVGQYWAALGLSHLDGCDRNVPWSAAFISFMVREAGGGNKFKYSSAHRDYIHDAFAGGRGLYNSVEDIDTATIKTGDLICSGRGRIAKWDHSRFESWYKKGGTRSDAIPTHCDIVVCANNLTVIGGNVNHRVTRKRVNKSSYAIVLPVTR